MEFSNDLESATGKKPEMHEIEHGDFGHTDYYLNEDTAHWVKGENGFVTQG